MRTYKFTFFITLILNVVFISNIYAKKYSGLYIFGDSLSSEKVWNSRNSNLTGSGKNWQQYFDDLVLNTNGTYSNYAVGGYWSDQVTSTINSYLASNTIDLDALYVVWGGINDSINRKITNPSNILDGVTKLNTNGANYILVLNLFNAKSTSKTAINAFNTNLRTGLNKINGNIIQADIYNLVEEIYLNTSSFNVSSLFVDSVHFTKGVREIIADYCYHLIEAPALITLLPEAPLEIARNYQNSIEIYRQINVNQMEDFQLSIFGGASKLSTSMDSTSLTPSYDNSNLNIILGANYTLPYNIALGASIGFNTADIDFGASRGDYTLSSNFYSFIADYEFMGFFVSAILSSGSLTYDDISRNITLGSTIRSHSGSTDGSYSSTKISLGLYVEKVLKSIIDLGENISFGPLFSINQQEVSVDGYTESGSLSSSMHFASLDRDSNITSIGIFGSFKYTLDNLKMKYFANILKESDSEDPTQTMTAGLNSLPGSSFKMSGFTPETDALSINIGAEFEFLPNLKTNVILNSRSGDQNSEQSIMVNVYYKTIDFSELAELL